MAEVGAKVSLHAIGKQDTYLTRDDPTYSFFKYEPKQHANFTKFHRSTNVRTPRDKDNWPFGETVKVTMYPKFMGDLLSNMYLYMKFPGVTGVYVSRTNWGDTSSSLSRCVWTNRCSRYSMTIGASYTTNCTSTPLKTHETLHHQQEPRGGHVARGTQRLFIFSECL